MISKYPIEIGDVEGIADAVNYLLSGPAGLGQNFDGFSDYNPLIIRPTFARPFTLPYYTTLDASWYVRLTATGTTVVGGNPSDLITISFGAGPGYTSPPFQFGDRLRLSGFVASGVDPDFWNGNYYVYSSTTTSVTLYTSQTYTWPAVTTLGSIVRDFTNTAVSTDCLAQVVVDSITQRNFINAQVEFTYTVNTETSPPEPSYNETNVFDIVVQVNRYSVGKNSRGNQVFSFQKTISQKVFPEQTGSATAGAVSAIFTTVIDQELNFGSYAYILEIAFVTVPTLTTGTSPGSAGYRTTAGSLVSDGFETAPLPAGVAAGNIQNQSTPGGTQYLNVPATVLSSNNPGVFINGPVLDVTVWPNSLLPEYSVGDPLAGGTVEIFNTRTLSNVQIVGVGGEFTCNTRGLRVGDSVQIQGTLTGTGTITGYASPTLYKISATNGSTTFTLTTFAGAPIVTSAGTTTGLTFDYDVLIPGTNSGYQPGDVIKILGTAIGGASPLNDLYLTVFTTSLDSNQVPGKFTMGLRNLTTQVIKQ